MIPMATITQIDFNVYGLDCSITLYFIMVKICGHEVISQMIAAIWSLRYWQVQAKVRTHHFNVRTTLY